MEFNKTIYKKDTKGKIRFLNVYSDNGALIQVSGIVGGKAVTHESVCKPKNIGKANETTAEQQAVLEAEAKIATKMSTGYFETQKEAEEEEVILPMLAKSYDKEKHKIAYPCYVQPKLDGMRCLAIIKNGKVTLMSRKGKEITTMDHIKKDLEDLYVSDIILDGELYAHGLSFQENMKLIKKYRPGHSEKIRFTCYDVVKDVNFSDRESELFYLLETTDVLYMEVLNSYIVKNEDEIKTYHEQFIAQGYEGTMVRWGKEGYKIAGRSSNLLKYKDFIDIACKVVDVRASRKDPSQGIIVCENEAGEFGCGMKFSHTERQDILDNKYNYIGQTAEIRFFEYTDDGLPRFPVCVGFRNDK